MRSMLRYIQYTNSEWYFAIYSHTVGREQKDEEQNRREERKRKEKWREGEREKESIKRRRVHREVI